MDQIRILLADDHLQVRKGTREILERQADLVVVAEASTGQEALALAKFHHPQVVIIDSSIAMASYGAVLQQLSQSLPECAILVLVTYDDQCYLEAIMQAGASGYLMRNARCHELTDRVRQIVAARHHEVAAWGEQNARGQN